MPAPFLQCGAFQNSQPVSAPPSISYWCWYDCHKCAWEGALYKGYPSVQTPVYFYYLIKHLLSRLLGEQVERGRRNLWAQSFFLPKTQGLAFWDRYKWTCTEQQNLNLIPPGNWREISVFISIWRGWGRAVSVWASSHEYAWCYLSLPQHCFSSGRGRTLL